jgi:hypothetical protein
LVPAVRSIEGNGSVPLYDAVTRQPQSLAAIPLGSIFVILEPLDNLEYGNEPPMRLRTPWIATLHGHIDHDLALMQPRREVPESAQRSD